MKMSIGADPEEVAYDDFDDTSIVASYMSRTFEKRKELTNNLIKKDKSTFKKFINVVLMPFIERGTIKEPVDELLRINTDKFIKDGTVEYIDNVYAYSK